MFPVVGALIGAAVGLICLGLRYLGVPDLAAAALALGASAILTGALHEDGLADVADGFGGGRDRAAKLEIMRDSRLGTYGALILLVSFSAKLSALAAIPDGYVVPALIAAHALARGILPLMSLNLPYARNDGLARNAGQPDASTAALAAVLALMLALVSLSWRNALLSAFVAGLSALGIAWLARRQIGGQTGDVLGGAEQVGETAILVLLAARLA
jgi:adenosylcobinamide-GDP ribazoletransferase